jgi:hypothetical protein
MEGSFSQFTRNDKLLILVDGDRANMYIIIPRKTGKGSSIKYIFKALKMELIKSEKIIVRLWTENEQKIATLVWNSYLYCLNSIGISRKEIKITVMWFLVGWF